MFIMKYHFVGLIFGSVLAWGAFATQTEAPLLTNSILVRADSATVNSPCLSDTEISAQLQVLSSSQSLSQQESVQNNLIAEAKKSTECRKRVVEALLGTLKVTRLDPKNDPPSFYLWHYGSQILSSLKAVEALDLFIKHFDLDDGTAFPLNHHPTVVNIIRMGSLALPKLEAVLLKSNDPNSRHYAVFCIASIGGTNARKILEQALPLETNPCVASFIKASLDAFQRSGRSDQIASEAQTEWYGAFLCNSR
jgi:hypothetical protein